MTTVKVSNEKFPIRITDDDFEEFVHGTDWSWSFQIFQDDGVTPEDTTGWTCDVYLMESENGEVYDTFTNGSGVTMTAASGLFVWAITDTEMDTYNFQNCIIKVILTDDSGIKKCYFIGRNKFAQV